MHEKGSGCYKGVKERKKVLSWFSSLLVLQSNPQNYFEAMLCLKTSYRKEANNNEIDYLRTNVFSPRSKSFSHNGSSRGRWRLIEWLTNAKQDLLSKD